LWAEASGPRGCGSAATPVLSTDVCCSRILFSKTIASSLGACRIAMFPRDTRARGFTPQRSLRRTDRSRQGVVFPSRRSGRRTSDAPSPAGSPGGAVSTGVGPPSLSRSQVETRRPRPTPPSRVNGFPWCCSGPKHLLTPTAVVRIGDPIRPLPRPGSFRNKSLSGRVPFRTLPTRGV